MRNLNLLVACFTIGDTQALRMALASNLYNRRHPSIKDDIGFQPESQNNIKLNAHGNQISNFVKGKAPMMQDREDYILYHENYPEQKIRTHNMFRCLNIFIFETQRLLAYQLNGPSVRRITPIGPAHPSSQLNNMFRRLNIFIPIFFLL
jgi:hypothetical protein